jgi:protease-4
MRRTLAAAALCLASLTHLAGSQAQQSFFPRDVTHGLQIPGGDGVAGDYDATAISLNPAGLATLGANSFALVSTVLDDDQTLRGGGGWGAFLALPVPFFHTALGFSWQELSQPKSFTGGVTAGGVLLGQDARQITTSLASGNRHFGFGVTYAHLFWDNSPQYQGVDTIHFGVTLRPSRFWALGATVRDVLAPTGRVPQEKFDRSYEVELALRPLGDARLEVAGGAWIGEEDGTPVDARARLLLRPLPGLAVYGQYDSVERRFDLPTSDRLGRDDRVLFGVTLDTDYVGVSYAALTSHRSPSEYAGSSMMLRISGDRYPSLFAPAHVRRLRLDGGTGDRDFVQLVVGLRKLAKTRDVRAVLLEIDGYDAGWAHLEELRAEIAGLRAAGKPVFAYLSQASTRQYYLAAACDRIFANPGGGLRLTGGASTGQYVKNLLDKLGVTVQVVKIAEYKSMPEMFTRSEASGPAREEREVYIRDILNRVAQRIVEDRHLPAAQAAVLFDQGPYLAPQARERGLVDELRYQDELEEALSHVLGRRVAIQDAPSSPLRAERWAAPQIAVIHVDGDISPGKDQTLPLWGHLSGGDSIADAIKAARESPQVRAIVLRVDSPGGAVEPSEKIAREMELTHGKKPLVVSMGDVAASGGYMVSARGDRIFAEPSTITGSIGIFYYKADLSALARTVGITTETIKVGEHADMDSFYRSWTAEEERIAFGGISYFYDRFLTIVSEGRGVSKDRVNEIGRGRVWTGAMAQPLHLVDQLGGFLDALADAKRRAGLADEAPVELVQLPHEPRGELSRLLRLVGEELGGGGLHLPDLPVLRELARAVPAVLLWGTGGYARMPEAELNLR